MTEVRGVKLSKATGAAGVVVGRGCLGRPWLFRDLAAAFAGEEVATLPTLGEVRDMMRRHAELLCQHMGEERGCKEFRKHVSWYLKGFAAGGTMRRSLGLVSTLADLDALLEAIKRRAYEYKLTPTIGRSHGIHAEPVTFGLKMAEAYAEFARCKARLVAARAEIATCAISGAVGTFANIDPRVEAHVAAKLGLAIEPVSTQVIPRDRHAMFFATLGVIASSIERLSVEVRHLQRTEVLEAEEYFSPGQKGSSAMPHKRNPVLTENLTGLARMVRSAAIPAMENVALWHERDISHSSVERFIGPDATITLDFALARLTGVVDKLLVYPERMQANMDRMGGLIHSQRVLLALTQNGVSREDAYRLVQRNAMKVWESDGQLTLLDLLKRDEEVTAALGVEQLEEKFDLEYHFKHVDTIFARVFG